MVAKGTSAGLLDEARSQSVFKHAILQSYLPRFAAMTGKWAQGNRVVLLDGFAGRGRYPDGKPASGEQMLLAARKIQRTTHVEVMLVEREHKDFLTLSDVAAEYSRLGITAEAFHGEVENYLDEVVHRATGVPLFLFLDPCGANVQYEAITKTLSQDRRLRRAATEALMNISADLIRRAAGCVSKGQLHNGSITKLDNMCGGRWWQPIALAAYEQNPKRTWEAAADAVVNQHAQRLAEQSGMRPVVVPVRRKIHHQPVYYLVFLTRAPHGRWIFGDALAHARQQWLRVLGPDDEEAEGMLFNFVEDQIESESQRAYAQLKENITALADRGRAKLVDHPEAVFGSAFGLAQEKQVRQAVRELNKANEVQLDDTAPQPRDWIIWR
ncbi:three-Cys-motif partner protein TcmP [Mycobacteroides abscessus subsp. abscessus]|uniref:three-Cys-motif partner protein TcmP n=1 Tax=Mycobacteroides abscessus TaxID=36809 RepID=UPI0019D04D9C|nr:three-Cys-motif partner protein TcmP [Mycobacteroides abscessus]MBN7407839.1 three-Cys-motif partner protein TcmP [Mycobacteroides abscessus subsp. abscessus]